MSRMLRWVRSWTRYDVLWLGWLASFCAIEASALRDAKRGNTFSEAWWWATSAGMDVTGYRRAVRVMALCFSAWLMVHLWSSRRNYV